jgi:hypothetical protein
MPRKSPQKPTSPSPPVHKISEGAGMTAGLEIWCYGTKYFLHDRTIDKRFAVDVETWNSALSLNATDIYYIKNATQ